MAGALTVAQQQAVLDASAAYALAAANAANAAASAGPGAGDPAQTLLDAALIAANTMSAVAAAAAAAGPGTGAIAAVAPRIGGINTIKGEQYAWTGGGNLPATRIIEPSTVKAYRPTDFKALQKMEKECEEGLPTTLRLSTPDKTATDASAVTLQLWIDRIKDALEARGMDSVFRMENAGATTEYYLMEEFGRADVSRVRTWVTTLRAKGCAYDAKNLAMSGKMMLESLDVDMLKKASRDLEAKPTGPEVYAVVINIHQTLNTGAVRVLTEQLQKLKLSKEPAENVESFSEKVLDIAKRIEGAGAVTCPPDLAMLVYECYQDCSTPAFAMNATDYYNKATDNDPSVDDWEASISKFKAKYRSLITRKTWQAAKYQKEKVEAQAMQASIKTLLQKNSMSAGKSGAGKGTSAGGSTGTDTRECYHCGKVGHIKPDCPDKNKPKASSKKKGAQGGGGGGKSDTKSDGIDRKKAPADGEPHTKNDSSGVPHKWCGTCKRWSKGDAAHLTAEHVKGGKGKETAAAPTAAAVLAAADDSNDNGATFRLISGYVARLAQAEEAYCDDCKCVIQDGDIAAHLRSYEHQEAKIEALIELKQNKIEVDEGALKVEGTMDDPWIRVESPRVKRPQRWVHLKGRAGQR
jgi:hypothetical protein